MYARGAGAGWPCSVLALSFRPGNAFFWLLRSSRSLSVLSPLRTGTTARVASSGDRARGFGLKMPTFRGGRCHDASFAQACFAACTMRVSKRRACRPTPGGQGQPLSFSPFSARCLCVSAPSCPLPPLVSQLLGTAADGKTEREREQCSRVRRRAYATTRAAKRDAPRHATALGASRRAVEETRGGGGWDGAMGRSHGGGSRQAQPLRPSGVGASALPGSDATRAAPVRPTSTTSTYGTGQQPWRGGERERERETTTTTRGRASASGARHGSRSGHGDDGPRRVDRYTPRGDCH